MVKITTVARIYHRIGVSDKDIESEVIKEYIEDAQAIIEGETERVFAEGDTKFELARAACTDLAAAYALIRILGGSYSGLEFDEEELEISSQQSTKIQLVNKYLARVNVALAILNRGKAGTLPRSTTT
jgi:hypothetical protein